MTRISKQRGHAALLFVMIIPALFGLFALASDGARAIQSKARIEDASEVTVLAIAEHNDDNIGQSELGQGSAVNQQIASRYVNYYLGDLSSIESINVRRLNCEDIPECLDGLAQDEPRFFQYELDVVTRHQAWFPKSDGFEGFDETFDVKGASMARKYQNQAVDVVFAADFSGSMDDGWNGGNQTKIQDLMDVIEEVVAELEKFNENHQEEANHVGIAPFDFYTRNMIGGREKDISELIFSGNSIDYGRTVEQVFIEKNQEVSNSNADRSNNVELTDDFEQFRRDIRYFRAGGGTSSVAGTIRAAQMLQKGESPRRLLIILSDGEDNPDWAPSKYREPSYGSRPSFETIGRTLMINYNMCDVIRSGLSDAYTPDGTKIEAKIAVIGFDYDVNDNDALMYCAGEDNVYEAQNRDEILNNILELITEEIGHLGNG
ncbi:TadE/TadG family type IV pilus assembly protein [Vibrio paucivorans]|uniref:TadG n=1 Tax=Vibrio paucivorans TaxID=2829489 RepID=A0A9X3CD77_9VIBR|nr:TadG [Vibrio paucivorans]MCW8333481.1 TadG [Vibrio paucivorans]